MNFLDLKQSDAPELPAETFRGTSEVDRRQTLSNVIQKYRLTGQIGCLKWIVPWLDAEVRFETQHCHCCQILAQSLLTFPMCDYSHEYDCPACTDRHGAVPVIRTDNSPSWNESPAGRRRQEHLPVDRYPANQCLALTMSGQWAFCRFPKKRYLWNLCIRNEVDLLAFSRVKQNGVTKHINRFSSAFVTLSSSPILKTSLFFLLSQFPTVFTLDSLCDFPLPFGNSQESTIFSSGHHLHVLCVNSGWVCKSLQWQTSHTSFALARRITCR